MKTYYWSEDSWGSMEPPANADEIIREANGMIDDFIDSIPDYCESTDAWKVHEYSDSIWEQYTNDDGINGIKNIYSSEIN